MLSRIVDIVGAAAAVILALATAGYSPSLDEGQTGVVWRASQGYMYIAGILLAAAGCFVAALRSGDTWLPPFETGLVRRRAVGLRILGLVLLIFGGAVLYGVRSQY